MLVVWLSFCLHRYYVVRISIILQIVYVTVATICYLIVEFQHRGKLQNASTSIALTNLVIIVKKQNIVQKF